MSAFTAKFNWTQLIMTNYVLNDGVSGASARSHLELEGKLGSSEDSDHTTYITSSVHCGNVGNSALWFATNVTLRRSVGLKIIVSSSKHQNNLKDFFSHPSEFPIVDILWFSW